MKRLIAAGAMVLLCVLPLTAGAAGEKISKQKNWEPEVRYSSYYSSEVREKSARSMALFNYGRGEVIEFSMVLENHEMNLTVRKNMEVVWTKKCRAERDIFSVVQKESADGVYFRITMGTHRYLAKVTAEGQLDIREDRSFFVQSEREKGSLKKAQYK